MVTYKHKHKLFCFTSRIQDVLHKWEMTNEIFITNIIQTKVNHTYNSKFIGVFYFFFENWSFWEAIIVENT